MDTVSLTRGMDYDTRTEQRSLVEGTDEMVGDQNNGDCCRERNRRCAVVYEDQGHDLNEPLDQVQRSWVRHRTDVVTKGETDGSTYDQVSDEIFSIVFNDQLRVVPEPIESRHRCTTASSNCKRHYTKFLSKVKFTNNY